MNEANSGDYLLLSERAQAYVNIATDVNRLQRLAQEYPDDADNYTDEIAQGVHLMHMFEQDAAVDFVRVAEHVEPTDVAKDREQVMGLIDHPVYGKLLTPEDIERELSALPEFKDYSPEVREFAADYVGRLATWLSSQATPRPEPEDTVLQDDLPEPTPDTSVTPNGNAEGKVEKPKLTVTLYRDLTIQIGDGEKVPLLRAMDIPKSTEEERQIALDRWGVLKTIAGHEPKDGDRGLSSRDTWITYDGGDSRYNAGRYADDVVEILADLNYNDEPLVIIEKTTPASKRRYHRNGSFDIQFVESVEHSGLHNPNVFELPIGEILFGKRARIAHALMGASEDNPFTPDMLEESDVYSAEDRERLSEHSLSLSSIANYLKRELSTKGVGDMFELSSVRITGGNPLERPMAYWLKYVGVEDLHATHPHLYQLDNASMPRSLSQNETEEDRNASIFSAIVVAELLVIQAEELSKIGLPIFDQANLETLRKAYPRIEDIPAVPIYSKLQGFRYGTSPKD